MTPLDRADVVVVGGGVVGVCTAWFLAERGADVVLVERHELAAGATGRNMGYVWQQTHASGTALELCRAGRALYERFAEELGARTFLLRRCGGMIHFHSDGQRRAIEEFVAARRRDGVTIELLDPADAREFVPMLPPTLVGATLCPDDAQLVAPRFVHALGEACRRRGVRVYEGTAATGLLRSGDAAAGVATNRGEVSTGAVVWCTGAWGGEPGGVELPLRVERLGAARTGPVTERLHVLLYGPLAARACPLIRAQPSYSDDDFPLPPGTADDSILLETVAQTQGGRLLVGCWVDYPGAIEDRSSVAGVSAGLDAFARRFPQYRELGIERVWSACVGATADGLPILDRADHLPGLYISTGHAFGNSSGPVAGLVLAQLVNGEEPALDLEPLRLDRPALRHAESAGAGGRAAS